MTADEIASAWHRKVNPVIEMREQIPILIAAYEAQKAEIERLRGGLPSGRQGTNAQLEEAMSTIAAAVETERAACEALVRKEIVGDGDDADEILKEIAAKIAARRSPELVEGRGP